MKRGKRMLLLLGALVVLLCGYGLIGRLSDTQTVSETEGSYPLWAEGAQVASLGWTQDGEALAFSLGESVWTKDGDASFPVNQTAVQNLADKISALTAVRELTDVTKPEDYGLAEPAFTVTAGDEGGAQTTYSMGDETPFGDGYYLGVSGTDAIYVIESSLASAFDKTLTQLASMESLPEVTQVTRVTVGDTLDMTLDGETGEWTDAATGEALDAQLAADMADTASGLTWSSLIATGAGEEELSAWALDDAQAVSVTLWNGDAAERTLLLGGADENGDRYARLPGSAMVYLVSGEDADSLLGAGVESLWRRSCLNITADQIASLSFIWDGGEVAMTAEDGESTTMDSITELLCGLEGTERVAISDPGSAVLTVLAEDAQANARELVFYAYDVDSYLLPITQEAGMLVPAEDVDKLIRLLRQQG